MRGRLRRENCRSPRWLEQGKELDDRRLVVHWWISSMSNGSESLDQFMPNTVNKQFSCLSWSQDLVFLCVDKAAQSRLREAEHYRH